MAKKPDDPIRRFQRRSIAARRIGERTCSCGENRPEALITGSRPTICSACRRKQLGHTTFDNHHPAGSANHPATVPVPANDHQTLTDAQYDWPKPTWEIEKVV